MHSTATIDTESRAKSFPGEGTELYQTVEARAERELEWYFANAKASAPSTEASEAVANIQARLATLLAFHRGAIARFPCDYFAMAKLEVLVLGACVCQVVRREIAGG